MRADNHPLAKGLIPRRREKSGRRQRDRKVPAGSYLYVMEAGPFIKVGSSVSPAQRAVAIKSNEGLKEISIAARLPVPAERRLEIEMVVHKELRKLGIRMRGEWYLTTSDVAFSVLIKVAKAEGVRVDLVPAESLNYWPYGQGWHGETFGG